MIMMVHITEMIDEIMGTAQWLKRNPCYQNLVVIGYDASTPVHCQDYILQQLLDLDSTIRLLIASPALGTGTNVQGFTRSVHIGMPPKLIHLIQMMGRIGRGQRVWKERLRALIYASGRDISNTKRRVPEKQLVKFVKSCATDCVRQSLYDQVTSEPLQGLDHACCSACSRKCSCDQCVADRAGLSDMNADWFEEDPFDSGEDEWSDEESKDHH